MRKLIILVAILILFLGGWNALVKYIPPKPQIQQTEEKVKIIDEESVVVNVVENVSPSVVTVGIQERLLEVDPFDPFGMFRRQTRQEEQDIASGFIVSSDGLIVTNKHVTGGSGKYKVITHDGKKYDVEKIYKDPANDIAILKINAVGLKPVEMGDSSKIKVGQMVVAIGTPLGEFRGSVTKGIVSGLGRGITTGSPFEGFVEKLDDVIQTDAAINPGNSGGPLVNFSGQVIGVNTAIASEAENIGFAIPINVVKDSLKNFNETGQFNRPYLGVAYKMISRDSAIRNDLPEGAYVQQVVEGSSAAKAGIEEGDIITKIDGQKLQADKTELSNIIAKKKVGDTMTITIWRDGKSLEVKAILETAPNQ